MKKVLALVLAFAMVFSSISFVFAETEVSDEAAALATIGMLEGDGSGVTADYETKELNRLTAAIMILKLRGLYEEALEYDGVNNFVDAEELKWEEGRNILAYIKDNPIGFGGNEKGEFMPNGNFDEQMLYKVLLENLGYNQTTDEVVGDFAWDDTLEFAESIGLVPANPEVLTVGELAKAIVAALKTNVKDGKPWIEVLVESEKVALDDAVAAGLMDDAPELVEVEVKEAKAIGNTVVEVKFKEAVGEEAENLDNYEIEDLDVLGAVLSGEKLVRLETAAQKAGKVYKLTVGEKTVKFTGVAKVSGGPNIDGVVSEDVEEVVITFDKNIDLEAGSNVENYSIAKIEVIKAEVDGDEVTLTTEGLQNKTKYTVKVTNMVSVDGGTKKSSSDSFTVRYDLTAPKIADLEEQTNQRIKVTFSEEVTQESAEDIDNYSIKRNKTDGDEIEILSITWDDDDEDNVEIVTEAMESRKEYKLTVNNIEDQRKVANVMTRPATKTFKAPPEDKSAPTFTGAAALSPTSILVTFADASKIDEDTVLDLSNYSLKDLDVEDIETVENEWKTFRALLTVEEMEVNKSYELKVTDIADEFGNTMSEKKRNVSTKSDSFASVYLKEAKVIGENKIKLEFSGDIVKSTAEDISNYKINKDVGAPRKAKLKDDKFVELEVSDLIDSEKPYYKVTVNGVEDLAGNVLYYKDVPVTQASDGEDGDSWDSSVPELEYVEALNKYVVALTFDEKVKFSKGTYIKIKAVDDDGDEYELYARDYADDDETIEFSNYQGEDNEETVTLDPKKDYTIVAVTESVYGVGGDDGSIKDYRGNIVKFFDGQEALIDLEDFEFSGSDADPDVALIETYEQKNGKTFVVTMTRDIDAVAGQTVAGFEIEKVKDDEITLKISTGKIKEEEYEVNLAKAFTDKHGIAVEDDYEEKGYSILDGEYEDDEEPYVDDVVAVNRELIKVIFNEDVDEDTIDGKFTLRNYDLDKDISIAFEKLDPDNDNEALFKVTGKALELRYEYELILKKDSRIKDIAGNEIKGDAESYYFQGTNLSPRP